MEKEGLISLLKAKGHKITPGRIAILEIFAENTQPINAEFVCGKLKKGRVNCVTVYRALESFEKSGILKRVDLRRGSAYFEFPRKHHHHIVCVDCGATEDFELCNVGKTYENIIRKSAKFRHLKDHSLELFGVCNECAKKNLNHE
jgi:Fur family zinc uptake transcriptional regulator